MQTPRLILVRHGRSAHVERGWLDAEGLARWNQAYDAASITPELPPPPALRALAQRAACIVASDMPRAIASAELLAGPRMEPATSPLLREVELPLPTVPLVRLPLMAWALVLGAQELGRRVRGVHAAPEVTDRAGRAADWLLEVAERGTPVIAVTHGSFRAHLARSLEGRGLRSRGGGIGHWSAWEFG
jgi:broad specificity phosphatase PhoE